MLQDHAGDVKDWQAIWAPSTCRMLAIVPKARHWELVIHATARSPRPVETQSLEVLTDVATRHYLHGTSQIEIARDLGVDPSTISRYLKRARDEGIVKIEIVPPRRKNVELGLAVAQEFGLSRAVVAELDELIEPITAVASVAADFISDQLRVGLRIGIGWGETLAAGVSRLTPRMVSDLQVALLSRGLADAAPGIQGHELARQLVELFPGSPATHLHAPSIVDSAAICQALLADRSVQAALAAAGQTELAIVGIGNM